MRSCPLCGRKYVKASQVVLPPTKEEALAQWRANRRAAKAAALVEASAASPAAEVADEATVSTPERPAIPAARASDEVLPDVLPQQDGRSTTWTWAPIEVQPKLLTVGAAAMFVSAFALGESAMLALQGSF